jgi:hypothetical protein
MALRVSLRAFLLVFILDVQATRKQQIFLPFWGRAPWGVVPLMFMLSLTERIEL